jgi:hypothetical protein
MKRYAFAIVYSLFVVAVLSVNWHDKLFSMNQPMAFGKLLIWLIFIAFSLLTIYYSYTEDFFKSLKKILGFKWGIQIGLDLTIGLFLSMFIIYWHSDSAMTVLLWLFPFIAFGNLATLLYFIINYDSLVATFFN